MTTLQKHHFDHPEKRLDAPLGILRAKVDILQLAINNHLRCRRLCHHCQSACCVCRDLLLGSSSQRGGTLRRESSRRREKAPVPMGASWPKMMFSLTLVTLLFSANIAALHITRDGHLDSIPKRSYALAVDNQHAGRGNPVKSGVWNRTSPTLPPAQKCGSLNRILTSYSTPKERWKV